MKADRFAADLKLLGAPVVVVDMGSRNDIVETTRTVRVATK